MHCKTEAGPTEKEERKADVGRQLSHNGVDKGPGGDSTSSTERCGGICTLGSCFPSGGLQKEHWGQSGRYRALW